MIYDAIEYAILFPKSCQSYCPTYSQIVLFEMCTDAFELTTYYSFAVVGNLNLSAVSASTIFSIIVIHTTSQC